MDGSEKLINPSSLVRERNNHEWNAGMSKASNGCFCNHHDMPSMHGERIGLTLPYCTTALSHATGLCEYMPLVREFRAAGAKMTIPTDLTTPY